MKGALAVALALQIVGLLFYLVIQPDFAANFKFRRPVWPLATDHPAIIPEAAVTTGLTSVQGEDGAGSTSLAHQVEGSATHPVAEKPRPTLSFPPDVRFIISLSVSASSSLSSIARNHPPEY